MTRWRLHIALLGITAVVPLAFVGAFANPLGPSVVGGNATVTGTGTANVTVNQSTQNAVINWQTFNLGVGDKTQFIQPNSTSMTLNRVTGQMGPSTIYGEITANGRIFIVNPEGILIGRGATINTSGFLATTHDIANSDFMANRLNFNIPGRPDASIVNEGIITANNAGFAALVAPGVRNSGTITATFGKIGLAAANGFTLDLYGDRLITLNVNDAIATQVRDVSTGQTLSALVKNEGVLKANGGRVELTAAAARVVVDSVINTSGVIEARTIGRRDGKIVLGGATKVAGLPKQTVKVSGKLSVASKKHKAGTIQITGENIQLAKATLDATGYLGGGTVLIGGDAHGAAIPLGGLRVGPASTVSIDGATVINASATHIGDAGKVVVWADQTTTFAGTILARGGDLGGNGAFVEVSGEHTLNFFGLVDTRAPHGRTGTLLLDPDNYTIGPSEAATIANNLQTTDVKIETTFAGVGGVGDIIVNSNVTWSSDHSLTLSAYRNIEINSATIKNTAAGDLILRADNTGTGIGTLILHAGTFLERIDYSNSTGKISLYYNPTFYPTPDVFPINAGNPQIKLNGAVADQFTAYMLVNNIIQFGQIALNLGGNYALSKNLDATGYVAVAPNLVFTGVFDGLGYTISNAAIVGAGLLAENAGTIRNVTLANFNVAASADNQAVGILAGINSGTISNVAVTGTVTGNAFNGLALGGLVGINKNIITSSSADVAVTSAGINVALGGLAGINMPGAQILDSFATGNVTATANLPMAAPDCGATCPHVFAGGLVGANFGTITSTFNFDVNDVSLNNPCGIGLACATGTVSVGARAIAGGLVGYNDGILNFVFATGDVLGAAGPGGNDLKVGGQTVLGGLVGRNTGAIAEAFAFGNAGALNVAHLRVGGLVGDNSGTIGTSIAFGNVLAGDYSVAGGLVGANRIDTSVCAAGCIVGDGHDNTATINTAFVLKVDVDTTNIDVDLSTASIGVSVGTASIAGGLVGLNTGTLAASFAIANVVGGGNSFLGGAVGVAVNPGGNASLGIIDTVGALGAVTATGPNSVVGGFVGLNAMSIANSFAFASVNGTSTSYLGGFAGINLGTITMSSTIGVPQLQVQAQPQSQALAATTPQPPATTVNATGDNNVIGGFAGANFGIISDSLSATNVTAGPNNILGALIGANATYLNVPDNLIPGSTFPVGTFTNSTATGTVNNNPGPQVGVTNPSTLPAYPSTLQSCTTALCQALQTATLPQSTPTAPTDVIPPPPVVNNPVPPPPSNTPPLLLTSLTPPAATLGPGPGPGTPLPSGQVRLPTQPFAPPQFTRTVVAFDGTRTSGLPPVNETRFHNDEVVLQMRIDLSQEIITRLMQEFGLTIVSSENLTSAGRRAIRFRIGNGRAVRDVIRAIEQNPNFLAQPNYQFVLTQAAQAPASLPPAATPPDDNRGDPAQYIIGKFHVHDVHRIADGKNIIIAVIDSAVDKDHPELKDTIAEQYDAVGAPDKPHSHATAMIGAIVARDRLLGVAPRAQILAVHAFSQSQTTAEGTTFSILKGIQWAVDHGARVINMSFAGPYDPALEKALKAAYEKGVVLVAAAGNAGPKSPPLFPGADSHVIGVTATDDGDKAFKGANVGAYISVSAPGVEILAPAPQDAYQMSTGTSIATAHVTAVVALMIERDPTLKPDDIRKILQDTATDLGTRGKDNQFGWGLVNPQKALAAVDARKKRPSATTR